MPLTVHHLGLSQSDRIVWLVEELGIPYELVKYDRDPETILAPQSLKALHPAGTSPVMIDDPSPLTGGKVALAESGAIVEYIINVHGGGKLGVTPKEKEYPQYVNWLHFSNATLQGTLMRRSMIGRLGGEGTSYAGFVEERWQRALGMLDARLKETGAYLAGSDVTAADIMTVCTLTTMRGFFSVDLTGYDHILAYLKRVSEREAYKRALEKGDPGLKPRIEAVVEPFDVIKNRS